MVPTALLSMELVVIITQELLSVVQEMSMGMALMISLLERMVPIPMVASMQERVMSSLVLQMALERV